MRRRGRAGLAFFFFFNILEETDKRFPYLSFFCLDMACGTTTVPGGIASEINVRARIDFASKGVLIGGYLFFCRLG